MIRKKHHSLKNQNQNNQHSMHKYRPIWKENIVKIKAVIEMQTKLEIVDMKNPVSWCFTPSQPVCLYQGDMKNPKSNKHCIYYFLQQCYGLKINIPANIPETCRLCFLFFIFNWAQIFLSLIICFFMHKQTMTTAELCMSGFPVP